MKRVAVIGAGHGGLGIAGFFAIRDHEVRVTDVNPAAVEPIAREGKIQLTALESFG